jgi:hypothetical protein
LVGLWPWTQGHGFLILEAWTPFLVAYCVVAGPFLLAYVWVWAGVFHTCPRPRRRVRVNL